MTTRTLQSAAPVMTEPSARKGFHPLAPALLSALLFYAAFPGADREGWSWLAWFALAPLFSLIRSERRRRSIYLGAFGGGLAFWLLAIHWVTKSDPSAYLAWFVMAFVLALWWPAFLALSRMAVLRLRLPIMVAAPVVWIALEFVQANVLQGFPWYYLAHTQYQHAYLIQIADLFGAWGLSFLMAMANAWVVDVFMLPLFRPTPRGARLTRGQVVRGGVMALAIVSTIIYGAARVGSAHFKDGPRLALLQSNFEQDYRNPISRAELIAVYSRLVEQAAQSADRPDLIVWPETAYARGFPMIDPSLDDASLARLVRSRNFEGETAELWRTWTKEIHAELHAWVDRIKVPMVIGSLTHDFHARGYTKYNSAVLIVPNMRDVQIYHKLHLVPFGEYVPLVDYCPWLVSLTPFDLEDMPKLAFGAEARPFDLKGMRYATAICFEDTVPRVVRRFFAQGSAGRKPDVLLNLTNDGWFYKTAEHEMHLAISVFRCVENRVPLARAVNTGISALVDANGKIVAALPKTKEGILSIVAPLDARISLYSVWGDWLPKGCIAVTLGLVVLATARFVRDRPSKRTIASLPGLPSSH